MLKRVGRQWQLIVATVLLLPLILYAQLCFQRPPHTLTQQTLFPGISYQRSVYSSPRPYILHLITLDLTTPGIRAFTTPGRPADDRGETTARTASDFLQEFDLQLAINANYFYPFREKAPWDFYPHTGDRVNLVGQAISNGNAYASAEADWPALCISPANRAQISGTGECPVGTAHAVAGRDLLILNNNPVALKGEPESDQPYSRTAVAVDKTGETLWLAIVDGKQPFYSEGITLAELTEVFSQLEVDTALCLDGGGSSTLVVKTGSRPTVLNAPIHTKILMRERPVANHLGFYAQK
ncbi:phosphodiester glycosidase family protein [Phormidium sp. FACHB-322]|nr:phosphodiester glycosidase family protein [Phormidium sp. FACHB-77]MBD2030979.1 phosphodiester glycosidase family protein [Phormidium sp. FACHB-322]MBD2054250.1 phosphodiester glycosidase family protein [Leptolyngbya sp. FACHB-60]